MAFLAGLSGESLASQLRFEPNSKSSEKCPLDRWDQSTDLWSWCTVLCMVKINTAYQHKPLIPIPWVCFVARGPEHHVIDSIMNSPAKKVQENGRKRKQSRCCNCPVQVHSKTWLKCCSRTLRELCINKCSQTLMNWSNFVKIKSCRKVLLIIITSYCFYMVHLQAIESWGVLGFSEHCTESCKNTWLFTWLCGTQ